MMSRRTATPIFKTLGEIDKGFLKRTVIINGRRYFYRIINPDAERIILKVHGVTGDSFDMVRVARVWADQGFCVIMPDLPGHGKSDEMPIDHFSGLSDWLRAFIQVVSKDTPPAAIIGNSFGSAVCYSYAAHYPLAPETTL